MAGSRGVTSLTGSPEWVGIYGHTRIAYKYPIGPPKCWDA